MSFVHLHRHSEYSLLDGMGSAEQYAKRASELGQFALAQTDHGNLCGALEHIQACEKYGIHPIVGVEAYFRPNRKIHDASNKKAYHLLLLADSLRGWRTLMRLTSEAYTDESYYYKPCIDYDLLERYNEGLICSTACIGGFLAQKYLSMKSMDKEATDHLKRLQNIFKDKLYIEIMPHEFDLQVEANPGLINIANGYGIPVIATVDAHYVNESEADTQQIIKMMSTQQTFEDLRVRREQGEDVYNFTDKVESLYLMSEEEVIDSFVENHPNISAQVVHTVINNTAELAQNIQPFFLNKALKLPRIRAKKLSEVLLREWCGEGLNRINEQDNPEYLERMEYELSILKSKDVLDYFVIIGEIVRWAKQKGIRVGPGRGSAAGCLVSYLCDITAVDPIAYDLLFERFLNPDRAGMPDIDVDFQSNRIDEVKAKFVERHGADHVSDVIAHQTFRAKSSIKDVSRVFNIPLGEVNQAVVQIDNIDLDEALATSKNLKMFADRYPEVIRHSQLLEGSVKTASQHAAAVVVTDKPITDYMPTMRARSGSPFVTAWSDKPSSPIISDYGFLKYDFLSTTGLAIQQTACEFIQQRHGIKIELDQLPVMRDPYAVDEKTMDLFRSGHTFGLFQFGGSAGITGMLKKLKPKTILDLAAVNALYRPGPLDGGVADEYISKCTGKSPIVYWHTSVEPFLEISYGIMIYQEQLMQVCQHLGNFTPGQADDMRKATGKLYRLGKEEAKEFMGQFQEQWNLGSQMNMLTWNETNSIWNKILAFGGYSFNKSHSVSYSLQAYQDGYLKANYPEEFYAALMIHDPKKTPEAIREALARGITILPPDINESDADMTLSPSGIRFGLTNIKGVGQAAVEEIVEKRPFKDLQDYHDRIVKRRCNSKVTSALLNVGAFDSIYKANFSETWDEEKPDRERELLGLAITGNEIGKYRDLFDEAIKPDEIELTQPKEGCVVGGEIVEVVFKNDKRGKLMCWATIAYGAESWRVTVFASMMPKYASLLWVGQLVLARVIVDDRGGYVLNFLVTPEEYKTMMGAH